jgi:hypothetical protein
MDTIEAAGVSHDGGIPAAPQSASQPAQGAALPNVGSTVEGLDPTQIPAYRKLQSERDRERAEFQRQLQERDARLLAIEARLTETEVSKVDALAPEEQAEYWRKQALAQQEAQKKAAEQAQLSQRAATIIAAAGYEWSDPRIQAILNRISPSPEGIADLSVEITRLVSADLQTARQAAEVTKAQTSQKVMAETQKAEVKALEAAGVTATSTAQPVIAPSDPNAARIAEFKARRLSLVGAGADSPKWRKFITDLSAAGMSLIDLGYG